MKPTRQPLATFSAMFLAAAALMSPPAGASPASQSVVDSKIGFNKHIRPLLVKNCYACHGDAKELMGNVMMKSFEEITGQNGYEAIVIPGDADSSPMAKRISSPHPEMRMPPEETGKRLTEQEIATIRQWINEGAEFEKHWAYVKPERPAVPEVNNSAWVSNPIDAFVLAKIEAAGLEPSPVALGRTLSRRLHLDLNGLLPDYERVVAQSDIDQNRQAYQKAVEALLANPQYGARMAVPWLDWVKYSDEISTTISPFYMYRNYVINAFNENKSFDEFTIEQVAGDLLGGDEAMVASGFNHLIVRIQDGVGFEAIHKYVTERVDKLGQVWLGSSFECAQCHDHKFDPILQADYYQIGAFFNDLDRVGVWHPGVSGDARESLNPDTYFRSPHHYMPTPAQERRIAEIEAELASLYEEVDRRKQTVDVKALESGIESEATDNEDYFAWVDPEIEKAVVINDKGEHPLRIEKRFPVGGNAAIVKGKSEVHYLYADELESEQRGAVYRNEFPLAQQTLRSLQVRFTTRRQRGEDFLHISTDHRPGAPLRIAEIEFWLQPREGGVEAVKLDPASVDVTDMSMQPVAHVIDGDESTTYDITPEDIFSPFNFEREGDLFLKGLHNEAFFTFALKEPVENADDYNLAVIFKFANADSAAWQYNIAYTANAAASPMQHLAIKALADNSVMRSVKQWLYEFVNENIFRTEFMDYTAQKIFSWYALQVGISSPVPFNDVMKSTLSTLKESLAFEEIYRDVFLLRTAEFRDLGQKIRDLRREHDRLWTEVDRSWASITSESRWTTRVLLKGEPTDTTGPLAERLLPSFLTENNGRAEDRRELNRLDLAQWLVSEDNPLTARVIVNRLWALFMGEGIVHTLEDFGSGGHRGTHPELLDWLAVEFMESGWDMQHMVRLIVNSSSYQQSSKMRPELKRQDPENHLYARQNVRQIEAEFIQDNALKMAGLLRYEQGGKHTVHGAEDNPYLDDQYRRSIYLIRRNSTVQPQLKVFGAKPRVAPVIERPESITPLQALAGLNQPLMFRVASILTDEVIDSSRSEAGRLRMIYQRVLARNPSSEEIAFIRKAKRAFYADRSDEAGVEREFWLSQIRTIMNLRETVTRV